jgi:hypothetical protein
VGNSLHPAGSATSRAEPTTGPLRSGFETTFDWGLTAALIKGQRAKKKLALLPSVAHKSEHFADVTCTRSTAKRLVLETNIDFADVVEGRQHAQARHLNRREILQPPEPSKPLPKKRPAEQRFAAGCDICAMID